MAARGVDKTWAHGLPYGLPYGPPYGLPYFDDFIISQQFYQYDFFLIICIFISV